MLLLLLLGVGEQAPVGDGVKAYGLIAFTLADNSYTATTLASDARDTTTALFDATTEED